MIIVYHFLDILYSCHPQVYTLSTGNQLPICDVVLFSTSFLLSCRESVPLPLILDVGSSTLWEIDKCIEYTGVQGVAVSGKD